MFRELGGFDPTFVFDYEDTDLCWRAWRRGWRTVYTPEAIARHHVGASFAAHPHQALRRLYSGRKNRQRFVWKTMDADVAILDFLVGCPAAAAKWFLRHRRAEAMAWFRATISNLSEIQAIAQERRDLRLHSKISNHTLLRYFIALGAASDPLHNNVPNELDRDVCRR